MHVAVTLHQKVCSHAGVALRKVAVSL